MRKILTTVAAGMLVAILGYVGTSHFAELRATKMKFRAFETDVSARLRAHEMKPAHDVGLAWKEHFDDELDRIFESLKEMNNKLDRIEKNGH